MDILNAATHITLRFLHKHGRSFPLHSFACSVVIILLSPGPQDMNSPLSHEAAYKSAERYLDNGWTTTTGRQYRKYALELVGRLGISLPARSKRDL